MRCAVATSPYSGPRRLPITSFQLLPEETVADAFFWAHHRKVLTAGSCTYPLGPRLWSGAKKIAWSHDQSHDQFASHDETLRILYPYGAVSLAHFKSPENFRREADPMRPGVGRPVDRLCCFLCRGWPRPGVFST